MNNSLGNTTVGYIQNVLNKMEKDTSISFEFIVSSFFPDAFENMQNLLKDAYTKGYMQAKDEIMYKNSKQILN